MKKVFLIDDDSDDREIFREALNSLDIKTDYIEAKDGQEGLDLITSEGFGVPDIIFVDLNMPRVNGLEFMIRTKELPQYQQVPIYIYTTSASPNERVNAITAGAVGYIVKHIRYSDLAIELKGILSKIGASA